MAALRLSKAGYGKVEDILAMRCDLVIAALEYEKFIQDYEMQFMEINKAE